jgi:threonine dehydratase
VPTDRCHTFADGMAVRVAIPLAVATLLPLVDEYVRASERAIATAVGDFARAGLRVEGSAGAPLAALDQIAADGPIVLIVSGSNIDEELHRRAVEHPESFPAAQEGERND